MKDDGDSVIIIKPGGGKGKTNVRMGILRAALRRRWRQMKKHFALLLGVVAAGLIATVVIVAIIVLKGPVAPFPGGPPGLSADLPAISIIPPSPPPSPPPVTAIIEQKPAETFDIAAIIARKPAPNIPSKGGLLMTTNRGPHPVYRTGENIHILAESLRSGYLYCFLELANRSVLRIHPSPFIDHAEKIKAEHLITIPDPVSPLRYKAAPPGAHIRAYCLTSPVSLDTRLAKLTGKSALEAMNVSSLKDLSNKLADIADLRQAGLIITVMKNK